jgi:recombination protein RecA
MMAKSAKQDSQDFASDLIKALNKEMGERIAYNLSTDESPTHVKRWISTGSRLMDYIVANKRDGGLPEGRIVEIFGPPSIGKSHIAIQIARSAQAMGGVVVYMDTENATAIENLHNLGVDVSKRFVYVQPGCTEEVFQVAESTILKARNMQKDVPVVLIWDSVAASSPKAEINGDYDKDSIGLQARAISKGMRKITKIIGSENVLFVCLNQVRTKIGVMFGDPDTTPGGKAIPFHASTRIKLGAGDQIKDDNKDVIGIHIWAKTIKNKVSPPFRKVDLKIIFGVGIKEGEEIFDILRKHCVDHGPVDVGDNRLIEVSGSGAWKSISIIDSKTGEILEEKKFTKKSIDELLNDPKWGPYFDDILEVVMVKKFSAESDIQLDSDSYVEVESAVNELSGN